MVFYNIFKKDKEKPEKENKTKIIIDNREKNSLVIANLIKQQADIELKQLEIGDYIIGEIIIERKAYFDFISSMINKRIFQQLEEIKKFPQYFLIIEGSEEQIESKNLKKAAKGLILSIITKYKIPILFAKDEEETAEIILILANKQEKSSFSLRPSRSFRSMEEQKQFILEGFPQIGPQTAKALLEKFKTLKEIFNSSEENLKEILGKKYEKFKEIINN